MKQLSKGCIAILRKLLNQRRVGGRHLPEPLALRPLKNLSKEDYRNALNDWEWCIKEGLVYTKPTHSGRHISLNHRRLPEIYNFVG